MRPDPAKGGICPVQVTHCSGCCASERPSCGESEPFVEVRVGHRPGASSSAGGAARRRRRGARRDGRRRGRRRGGSGAPTPPAGAGRGPGRDRRRRARRAHLRVPAAAGGSPRAGLRGARGSPRRPLLDRARVRERPGIRARWRVHRHPPRSDPPDRRRARARRSRTATTTRRPTMPTRPLWLNGELRDRARSSPASTRCSAALTRDYRRVGDYHYNTASRRPASSTR